MTLTAALTDLRDDLAEASAQPTVSAVATGAVAQLDDYVLPRLREAAAPLLAVVGGSTGSGKSTLVNAVVGAQVTRTGAIRPTTRDPILVYHPDDARWFSDDRILTGLPRVSGTDAGGDGRALVLRPVESIPPGLALLDAPDIDSMVDANRALATQLLAAADLWVFVTTAARYADAVPWGFLSEAAARDVVVAIVLDRVPPDVVDDVREDLVRLLAEHGLEDAPLFTVEESPLVDGQLPAHAIAPLRDWLNRLATDAATRAAVAKRTVTGAVGAIADTTDRAADTYAAELGIRDDLADVVTTAFDSALARIGVAMKDGTLLRGEVLARWQDFVGAGDFFRSLEARVGWLRDRIAAAVFGRPQPTKPVEEAIHSGLVDLFVAEADQAVDDVVANWSAHATGRTMVTGARTDPNLAEFAANQIRMWQADLVDLIRTEGSNRRATARILSYGVNAIGLALMIAVFTATGGITGVEAGVAGGTVVVGQRVLEAVFGDDAVRRLTTTARANLLDRARGVLDTQAAQFTARLAALGLDDTMPGRLRADAATVRERLGA